MTNRINADKRIERLERWATLEEKKINLSRNHITPKPSSTMKKATRLDCNQLSSVDNKEFPLPLFTEGEIHYFEGIDLSNDSSVVDQKEKEEIYNESDFVGFQDDNKIQLNLFQRLILVIQEFQESVAFHVFNK